MISAVVIFLMLVGFFCMLVAAIGFIRLPDMFSRLHVTGILDTLGAPLAFLAVAVYVAPSLTMGKLLLMIVLLYVSAPLIGNLLARAAIESGAEPMSWEDRTEDPNEEPGEWI